MDAIVRRMPALVLAIALSFLPQFTWAQDTEAADTAPAEPTEVKQPEPAEVVQPASPEPAGVKRPPAPPARPLVEPVWKVPLAGTQLDILELLPGDRLLVGTIREGWDRMAAVTFRRFLDLSMRRASTGALLWKFDRSDLNLGTFDVIAVDPVILCNLTSAQSGAAAIFAFDANTGNRLWRNANLSQVMAVPGTTMVYGVKPGLLGQSLVALRAADGSELWSAGVQRDSNRRPRVEIHDGAAYVIQPEITKVDLGSGKVLWREKMPVKLHPLLQIAYTNTALVLSDGETVAALDAGSGKLAWTAAQPQEGSLSLATDGGTVYQYARTAGGYALRALDATSGGERWRVNEPRAFQSALLMEPGRLTYATESHLVSVHPGTGGELLRAPLPKIMLDRDAAPRILRPGDGVVTVASQRAVGQFDLTRGAWSLQDNIANPASSVRAMLAPEQMEQVRAAVPAMTNLVSRNDSTFGNFLLQQSQRNVDYARREVERSKLSDATRADRQQANEGMRLALQGQIATMRMVQSQERSAAMQNLAASVTNVLEAITAALRRARALRENWRDADAAHAYAGMLHSDYYVRQRGGPNVSLHVVDLRRGANAALDLLTDVEPNRHAQTIHAIDGENRRIITLAMRPDPSAPLVDRFDKKVPARHLAAFDISALPFQPLVQQDAAIPSGGAGPASAEGTPPAPQK